MFWSVFKEDTMPYVTNCSTWKPSSAIDESSEFSSVASVALGIPIKALNTSSSTRLLFTDHKSTPHPLVSSVLFSKVSVIATNPNTLVLPPSLPFLRSVGTVRGTSQVVQFGTVSSITPSRPCGRSVSVLIEVQAVPSSQNHLAQSRSDTWRVACLWDIQKSSFSFSFWVFLQNRKEEDHLAFSCCLKKYFLIVKHRPGTLNLMIINTSCGNTKRSSLIQRVCFVFYLQQNYRF